MLTQQRLKELIEYNPDSGIITTKAHSKYCNRPVGSQIGCKHKTKGYRYVNLDGRTYREHRVAFLYMTGKWPTEFVDHINRIKDDNRWSNLREASPKENSWNHNVYKTNRSGYTGVVWNKQIGKWQVLVRSSGVQKYLGLYDDVHEAGKIASDWYKEVR